MRTGKEVTAAVLAGGQSRRMGQDKARVEIVGRTMLERVIERLAEMGLLDDLEFACEYVRQRIERSPRAPALLVNELGRRGVTGSTAAEAVNRALSEMELAERDLAERAVRKKLGTLAEIDTEQLKSKLFRFLSSRGFQASTARRVIEKMLDSF